MIVESMHSHTSLLARHNILGLNGDSKQSREKLRAENANVQLLYDGCVFRSYEGNPKVSKRKYIRLALPFNAPFHYKYHLIFLVSYNAQSICTPQDPVLDELIVFYAEDETEFGSLYYNRVAEGCVPNRSRRLVAEHLTDIYQGKYQPIFNTRLGQEANEDSCISISGETGSLNLEATDEATAHRWMEGFQALINCHQPEAAVEEPASPAHPLVADTPPAIAEAATPSYLRAGDYYEAPDVLPPHPAKTMGLFRSNDRILMEASNTGIVDMMSRGRDFFCYFLLGGMDVVRKPIVLFYDPKPGRQTGVFYWCKQGENVERESMSISMDQLEDVTLGKESACFEHPRLAHIADDKCWTVTGNGHELNLEVSATIINYALLFLYFGLY